MKKITKAVATIMLMTAVFFAAGCKPEDDPENGGGNNNGGGEIVEPQNGTLNGFDYVDLGLPSGTKWATFNVGADKPEACGGSFAWGETQAKSDFAWSNYKYGVGEKQLTKYCNKSEYGVDGFTDELVVLEAADDAATANWGEGWRTPTEDEWIEMAGHCEWTWTTQNDVHGMLFTAPNGNSIFLPANYNDVAGYYWSSSLVTEWPSDACCFGFESNNHNSYSYDRYLGRCVRPVCSPQ